MAFFPLSLLFYSLAVHFAVLSGHLLPAVILLSVVLIAGLLPGLRKGTYVAWLILLGVFLGGLLLWLLDSVTHLFYLPPILINVMLLVLFGVTLLSGNTPLITQFSKILKGNLEPEQIRYTKNVTQAWVLFFFCMIIETILLAIFAPATIWSLFTNFINYLFLLVFFILEYMVRVRTFVDVEHPGFFSFMRSIIKLDYRGIKTF